MAKASDQNGSDCEGRKLGERTGLDTPGFLKATTLKHACEFAVIFTLRVAYIETEIR
jgi:hypothetical protein